MTSNQLPARPVTLEEEERTARSMRDLLHSPAKVTTAELGAMIHHLSTPAERKWIAARVLTLLSQYFASSVPGEVMKAIADDWNDALKSYPAWAINRACRWWIGPENAERRKRPMPGDIAERAKREMGLVKMAKRSMAQNRAQAEAKPRPPLTDEQKQRMQEHVERLFPTLKRIGNEQ